MGKDTLRLRIAINGRFLVQPITGVQRVAREVTRRIDDLIKDRPDQYAVRLLCPRDADLSDLPLKNIKIERVRGLPGHMWEQLALPFAVRDWHLLCLGNTAPVVSLLSGRPVSVLVHDLSYRLFPKSYRSRYRAAHALMAPIMLRRSRNLITVSESEKAVILKGAPWVSAKITVAQNGGWRDDDDSSTANPIANEYGYYALYVGSFSDRKNYKGLMATAIRLAREDGLSFVFVGSRGTVMSPVHVEIPEDVRGKIRFLGHIENADQVACLYRNAQCLVFPSFYEASPLPPIEAMHFSCPVVASDIPSMRERCGDAAEYCDPSDVASIVAATRKVIRDPSRRAELIALGFEQAKRFLWRNQANAVLDAIERSEHANMSRLQAAP